MNSKLCKLELISVDSLMKIENNFFFLTGGRPAASPASFETGGRLRAMEGQIVLTAATVVGTARMLYSLTDREVAAGMVTLAVLPR